MRLRARRLIPVVLLLPAVLSCAQITRWVSFPRGERTPAPAGELSPPSGPASAQAADLAKTHLSAGEYQKALDVYNAAYEKQPRDPALLSAYVQSLEAIAAAADRAYERREIGPAGRIYAVLLNNYGDFKGFEKNLTFTGHLLSERLDHCKKSLYKQGFQEYRNGNISQAIVLWQDLLVIDPQNADIREALKTAKLQQKNLQPN
jgi:tetratricopeptide (TPR) repeat protein